MQILSTIIVSKYFDAISFPHHLQVINPKDNTTALEQECQSPLASTTSLRPGVTYQYTVKCHSTGGWSDFAKPIVFTTPSTTPSFTSAAQIQTDILLPDAKTAKNSKISSSYSIQSKVSWEEGEWNGEAIDYYIVEMKSANLQEEEEMLNKLTTVQSLFSKHLEKNYAIEVGCYCTLPKSSSFYWIYAFENDQQDKVRLIKAGDRKMKEYCIVDKDQIIIDHFLFTSSVSPDI